MTTLKRDYSLRITLIAQYMLEVSRSYNKTIEMVANECINRAIDMKYKKDSFQHVLTLDQTFLPLDEHPYLLNKKRDLNAEET